MKKYDYNLLILGCLSSLATGVAQAETFNIESESGDLIGLTEDVEALDIPISFSTPTDFMNVACNNPPIPRDVEYNLANSEANTINLDSIQVFTNPDDTAPNLTTTLVTGGANNCITSTSAGGTIGSGSITGYATGSGTCQITLLVTPPACPTGGVLQQTIDRELYIGVETREQSELVAEIDAEVSVIGAGAYFALIANSTTAPLGLVANDAADYGTAQISGNIGSSGLATESHFSINNGEWYNNQSAGADAVYTAAITDLTAAYNQLLTIGGCQPLSGLDNVSRAPGCYLLSPATGNTVTVSGTIELTGDSNQNYYFFVAEEINLDVDADTVFTYTNGGTAANVFWIMQGNTGTGPSTSGQVIIQAGAQLDGSVLSGSQYLTTSTAPAIITSPNGTSRAQVNGTLWSAAPAGTSTPSTIQLYGDSVTATN